MTGSLCVFAEEPAGRAAKVMLTMDVLQRICLGIVITAVVLFLIFYIVKAVLKKLHVAPEEKEEERK
jgi:ammonia channel protein AmtB